jgi:hypothetical protein
VPVSQRDINFFDPAVVADPSPYYAEIRAAGRVVWNDILHTRSRGARIGHEVSAQVTILAA